MTGKYANPMNPSNIIERAFGVMGCQGLGIWGCGPRTCANTLRRTCKHVLAARWYSSYSFFEVSDRNSARDSVDPKS